jgi:hypothetical protein
MLLIPPTVVLGALLGIVRWGPLWWWNAQLFTPSTVYAVGYEEDRFQSVAAGMTALGALLARPVAVNIAVMDWCFAFPASATGLITEVAAVSAALLWADRGRVMALCGRRR